MPNWRPAEGAGDKAAPRRSAARRSLPWNRALVSVAGAASRSATDAVPGGTMPGVGRAASTVSGPATPAVPGSRFGKVEAPNIVNPNTPADSKAIRFVHLLRDGTSGDGMRASMVPAF